jgi:hypothetical protein
MKGVRVAMQVNWGWYVLYSFISCRQEEAHGLQTASLATLEYIYVV